MNEDKAKQVNDQTKAHYSLLLDRMTGLVLSGKDLDKQRDILKKEEIWTALDPGKALKWSRLAQIAGEIELALRVLEHVNKNSPEYIQAWKERYELLWQLGRQQEAIQLKAEFDERNPSAKDCLDPIESYQDSKEQDLDHSEHIDSPFVQLKRREELLNLYYQLFQGREDCFARQWADKQEKKQGYVPVRRPMSLEDVKEHLEGRKTYGIYLLKNDNRVVLGVVDVDIKKELLQAKLSKDDKDRIRREINYLLDMVPEIGQKINLECISEFSGRKGYHFWYFFDPPSPAAQVRKVLHQVVERIKPDLSCFNLEVFPKQDRLTGKGMGNLVKLPLGIHRLTGKASYFLPHRAKDMWGEIQKLESVQTNNLEQVQGQAKDIQKNKEILIHPRHKEWMDSYPELALLQERCPALAQVFSSCHSQETLSIREEKVIYGVLGFTTRSKTLVHALMQKSSGYNPHYVDYKLSMVRGSVLGCKKIHMLLDLNIDYCHFENATSYIHPLLHCPQYLVEAGKSERVESLQQALDELRNSIRLVLRFLPSQQEE